MNRGVLSWGRICTCVLVLWAAIQSAGACAQPALTKTKRLTWDVIGLDSNDLADGPDTFVVGQRVCNTGNLDATNVEAELVWLTANTNIAIVPGTPATISIGTLTPAQCYDAYFNIRLSRSAATRNTARQYRVSFSADGIAAVDSPVDAASYNEIYVEDLISQNRNSIDSIVGPNTVYQGMTYTFTLNASTATQGYEQLQSFINFPNNIFRIVEVAATYSKDNAGTANDTIYSDACGWVHDPEDPDYFINGTNDACSGTGKEGGDIRLDYTIEIIGTGSATVTALITDFSGSSFHYNADFGQDILAVNALPAPALSVSDVSVVEGDTGSTFAVFTVSLDASRADADVQFAYATSDGSAVAGSDYTATTGTGTIAAGSLTTTISVPVITETLYEQNETFSLSVFNPLNASVSDGTGAGTIINDDGLPVVAVTDTSITEGGNLVFTLTLSGPSSFATTGTVTAVAQTAGAEDFAAGVSNFTFPAGSTTTTVTIPTTSDTLVESNETLRLVVSAIDGGVATGVNNFGTGPNIDDDVALPPPDITIGDATATEGDDLIFDITLSNPSAVDITVTLAPVGVTATVADYDGSPIQVTITAGSTTVSVPVPTRVDDIDEPDETLTLSIVSVDSGLLSDIADAGTGTIQDANRSLVVQAQSICVGDAPYLEYVITAVNFTPANDATIEWIGSDGSVVRTLTDQPLARTRILWPEAAVDADGNGSAWPGWEQRNGEWVQVPSLVRPAAEIRVSVNPTETVSVDYPAATAQCVPGPRIANTTAASRTHAIPTMSEWGLAALVMLIIGVVARRRGVAGH
ncbi:MAG: IPTL-CTERM sorting domain-containing protein [Halioglobus sp.]